MSIEVREYRGECRADGPELCGLFDCGQPATTDATLISVEDDTIDVHHMRYCDEHAPRRM